MRSGFLSLLLVATACATRLKNMARDACQPCNPQGATGTNPPAVGSAGIDSLYVDVVQSVQDIHFRKRWIDDSIVPREDGFCCQLDCVNVQNLNIPICYDKFTTNYAFPDGSYGTLATGDYTGSDGTKANLLSGQYTKGNGETGNIYSQDEGAKPDTATLSIPPQWTGTGVGSAIPASALASVIVVTATIPGITVTTPTIIPASTILETASGKTTAVTIPAQTITAGTTIPAATSLLTITPDAVSPSSPSSSNSKGAAGHAGVGPRMSFSMWIFTSFMYALYSL